MFYRYAVIDQAGPRSVLLSRPIEPREGLKAYLLDVSDYYESAVKGHLALEEVLRRDRGERRVTPIGPTPGGPAGQV